MRFSRSAAMNENERHQRDEATLLRDFWGKFGKFAAQLPFAEDLLTAYYCAFDRETPTHVRVALIGALAYFIFRSTCCPTCCRSSASPMTRRCWPGPSSWSGTTSSRRTATRRARRWSG